MKHDSYIYISDRIKWLLQDAGILNYEIRPMINFVKNHLQGSFIGVEIGVQAGKNAKSILDTLNIKRLYLVDPYIEFYQPQTGTGATKEVQEIHKRNAKKRLEKYKDKIEFVEKLSSEAAGLFGDNSLDFVYIDGNHDYDFVIQDITLWYPKVRSGGVIGGHDFGINWVGVVEAVLEYRDKHNLKLYGDKYDWWFIKK